MGRQVAQKWPMFFLKSGRWLCLLRLEMEVFPTIPTHLSHVHRPESARLLDHSNDSTRDGKHFCKYPSEILNCSWVFWWHLQKTLEIAKMHCFKITVTSRHVLSLLLSVINLAVSQATNFQVPRNNFCNQTLWTFSRAGFCCKACCSSVGNNFAISNKRMTFNDK